MTTPSNAVPRGRPPWYDAGGHRPGFVPFPAEAVESTIPDRLRAVADVHGDAIALRGPTADVTYHELWDGASRRAAGLVEHLGEGSEPLAILMAHGLPQVMTLLSVLDTGRPAVVLDPSAPPGLNRTLVQASGSPLLLADDDHVDLARDLAGDAHVLDPAATEGSVTLQPPTDAGLPALLAYTSGSSGDPKAAVIPHRQLLHLVRGATDTLDITATDRLPMLFPISLAVAAYPLFIPILNGGTLCTFDLRGEGLADVPAWMASESITVAYLAPTVLRFLESAVGSTRFPALRLVVLGGERVDRSDVALAHDLLGHDVVVANGYGTTETGVLTFWFDDGNAEIALPAGYPIDGMEVRILREDGRRAAPGESGEITVCSPYLFDGYWDRPDLDDLVLSRDTECGWPVYRTGDLGCAAEDGWIELTGRLDTQVKIRGRRVVLSEVESALLDLSVLKDAAVLARTTDPKSASLIAHVVPDPGEQEVTADRLRTALAPDLSDHMIPATFVFHSALPQLPNGKLDRRALADVESRGPALSTVFVEPAIGLESDVAALWEEVIDTRPVGAGDDFFDLGGDSLKAAEMIVRLETDLGHRLPMAVMLESRTVAELAATISARADAPGRLSALVPIQVGDPVRPVLFVAHDLHGSAFRFRHLAAALGSDQPVYGLESPFLLGEPPPFTRIDTLALFYVSELRRHRPHGPYHLLGYSFGGVLAFEMAQILRRADEEVALLAVVDVGPGYRGVGYSRRHPPPYPAFGRRTVGRRLGLDRRLLPVLWRLQLTKRGRIPARQRLWWAWQKHWDLVGPDWDARPYDGPLTLFWAEDTASTDATQGWGTYVEDLDIVRLDAPHEQIMDEDRVHLLAEPLRDRLRAPS